VSRRVGRVAAYVLLFVLGALFGAGGSFLQAASVDLGPVPLPVGLLAALVLCAGLFVVGAAVTRTRLGVIVPAVGWLLVVMTMTAKRPEGDVVLAQAATAYGYLFLGTLLAAVAASVVNILLLPVPARRDPVPDGRPAVASGPGRPDTAG
jgi:hypothetical protein